MTDFCKVSPPDTPTRGNNPDKLEIREELWNRVLGPPHPLDIEMG